MGGRNSREEARERASETAGVRSYYLIFGEPTIRYIRPKRQGPLIFDVTMDQDEDEMNIEHTETLHLPCGIPRGQDFLLTPWVRGNTFDGYKLSFRLSVEDDNDNEDDEDEKDDDEGGDRNGPDTTRDAADGRSQGREEEENIWDIKSEAASSADVPQGSAEGHQERRRCHPFKFVGVYAGVKVEYVRKKGVRLEQATKSQDEVVVLDLREVTSTFVETRAPIYLDKLGRTTYGKAEVPGSQRGTAASPLPKRINRLTAAPVCIAARIACQGKPADGSDSDDEDARDTTDEALEPETENVDTLTDGTSTSSDEYEWPMENQRPQQVAPAARRGRSRNATTNTAGRRERREAAKKRRKRKQASRTTLSSQQGETFDVMLFTFLEFPDAAYVPTRIDLPEEKSHSEGDGAAGASATAVPASDPEKQLEFKGRMTKQLLQIGQEVYDLEDIFDLAAADDDGAMRVDVDADENRGANGDDDGGNECVICLSNPKDTTLLPCRHMCLCYECVGQVRLSSNKCPICRCTIDRIMTI